MNSKQNSNRIICTKDDYGLFKQKRKKGIVWYFWYWDGRRRRQKSTGQTVKWKAKREAEKFIARRRKQQTEMTLKEYAEPYFDWDRCPHIRRLLDERKTINRRHARESRSRLDRYIFPDQISDKLLAEISRADIIDFRSRLLRRIPEKLNTVNKVLGTLKTVFKEAMIREDLDKDPTYGVGNIREERTKPGVFSLEELQLLFPAESFGPWQDQRDYTCFLLAASTGMRRGEVLALRWGDIELEEGFVRIIRAWKDRDEEGPPKWNHIRTMPFLLMKDRVVEALQRLQERSIRTAPNDLVFCYDTGERMGDTWWKKRFTAAMKIQKIDRIGRRLSPHSFRHTLNTLLRAANKDSAKIRAALGWKQESTLDGYTEFKVEDLEDLRLD